MGEKRRIVVLDRDGVICEYDEFLTSIEQFHLRPGVGIAIKRLNDAGFLVALATNQPLVARGRISVADLEKMHQHMEAEIAKVGGRFDLIMYCPHDPGPEKPGYRSEFVHPCDCRKPLTGMIDRALQHFENISLSESWMIGDSWRDLLMAQKAGLRSIEIVGIPERNHVELKKKPLFSCEGLPEAVDFILEHGD